MFLYLVIPTYLNNNNRDSLVLTVRIINSIITMNKKFGHVEKNRPILPTEARRRAQNVIGMTMNAYREYLNDAFRAIGVASDAGKVFCDYTVPMMIPKVPVLPYYNVIYHIIAQLIHVGYHVKFAIPNVIN